MQQEEVREPNWLYEKRLAEAEQDLRLIEKYVDKEYITFPEALIEALVKLRFGAPKFKI